MSFDKLVNHMIEAARREETKKKVYSINNFELERTARSLVKPARMRAEHHRERENHYTAELEKVEKEFRKDGISVEVFDPVTGMALHTSSGAIGSGSISVSNYTNAAMMPKFQPKVDQGLLSKVEKAKTKMLEHRGKADMFDKYVRAFSICPEDMIIKLTLEDIHTFQLEN